MSLLMWDRGTLRGNVYLGTYLDTRLISNTTLLTIWFYSNLVTDSPGSFKLPITAFASR